MSALSGALASARVVLNHDKGCREYMRARGDARGFLHHASHPTSPPRRLPPSLVPMLQIIPAANGPYGNAPQPAPLPASVFSVCRQGTRDYSTLGVADSLRPGDGVRDVTGTLARCGCVRVCCVTGTYLFIRSVGERMIGVHRYIGVWSGQGWGPVQ